MTEQLTNEEQNYEAYMADVGADNLARNQKLKIATTEQNNGELETRKSLAEGHGITFPNADEAIKWLKSGAEQRLIEKIAEEIENHYPAFNLIDTIALAGQIITLIKEAGYKSPEEVMEMFKGFENTIKLQREQLRHARDGYVKLADPNLPPSFEIVTPNNATGTGWRKVILEGKDESTP